MNDYEQLSHDMKNGGEPVDGIAADASFDAMMQDDGDESSVYTANVIRRKGIEEHTARLIYLMGYAAGHLAGIAQERKAKP